jgi:outer membrane protein insertion porin family|tara:strand:+ start:1505 stop:3742 length:2238 start_codon:yes stop_codon:yes gene_type:complete
MFRFILKILTIFFFLTLSSLSKNIDNIIVKGNERISSETILLFSDVPSDQSLDENSINKILKKLYESNFFKDVTVKIENKNLIIEVIENPIIQTIFIEGVKKETLEKSLYEILSLKNRSSFNLSKTKQDEITLSNYLKNEGYYFSEIVSSTQDLGNNKIDLFYKIDLGRKAKISKISFIGDKIFKDAKLRNIIISEEYKFWKLISGKKYLNENLINFDKRLLRNYYKNRGYYKVQVGSSFANYLGNEKFELIYNISSGKKYFFNDLVLKLPSDYNKVNFEELTSMFAELKGKKYSLDSIEKILDEIDNIVLNKQYEFLKSSVTEIVNNDLIDLTFNIEESKKFYVEKINIYGNNITQEEVLRNILLVDEGDPFNELLHNKTVNNLKALNYFKNVDSKILDGGSASQKIINITVEEKPTGEISAGAGLGTSGASVVFGLKENNFLGRGVKVGADLSLAKNSLKGLISVDNPNYKGSNRSLNFSAENASTDRLKNFGYESTKTGFSVGSGFDYYQDMFLNIGVSSYFERLKTDSKASASIKKQEGSYFDTFFNYSLDYDKRDQKYQPTDGFRSKFIQKLPLISDNYALTNTYSLKFYEEFFKKNILSYGFYTSSINSIASKNVRLSDRLYLPARKLRGFESGQVGPKDGTDFIGGNYIFAFNASTSMPQILPSFQNTNFQLFFDAANVWGVDYSDTLNDGSAIRSSVGLAIDFYTPVGPLSISFAQPVSSGKNDVEETFRFNLGTTF